ncbi:hypothetical protein CPB86DRAFT_561891 [Serendipita vermifera]|nr:hypothetical protein CPB86DRAFT_561891 [Serendipita vermifera]
MCAKSMALDLQINNRDRKSRSDLMNALISCKPSIRSLDFYIYDDEEIQSTMTCLNLGTMKNFSLRGVHHEVMGEFLDLLMQYDQDQMSITVGCYGYQEDVSHVLGHRALQRATTLELSIEFDEPLSSTKISVPQLKSLVLDGDQRILSAFDLTNLTSLKIWWISDADDPISLESLPKRLTTLSLRNLFLPSQQTEGQGPHLFPNLETLCLIETSVEKPLQTYFNLPHLKHLEINEVGYISLGSNEPRSPDIFFSPKPPNLESLSLLNIVLGETFIPKIQLYPSLKKLAIDGTNIHTILSSFTECLNSDTPFFPALHELKITKFKSSNLAISYTFSEYCASRRPRISLHTELEEQTATSWPYPD